MKTVKMSLILTTLLFLIMSACSPPSVPEEKKLPNVPGSNPVQSTPTPPPAQGEAHAAEKVEVVYRDTVTGVKATVQITRALDETDVSFYNLYWAYGTLPRLEKDPFARLASTGYDLSYDIPAGEILPYDTRKIFVFSENDLGEESNGWADTKFYSAFELNRVDDFNFGSSGSDPSDMFVFDDTLFFAATTKSNGRELAYHYGGSGVEWDSSLDIANGIESNSNPGEFAVLIGDAAGDGSVETLYFRAADGDGINRLYSLTADNVLSQISDCSDVDEIVAMNGAPGGVADNLIYFTGRKGGEKDIFALTTGGEVYSLSQMSDDDWLFLNPRKLAISDPSSGESGSDLYFLSDIPNTNPAEQVVYKRAADSDSIEIEISSGDTLYANELICMDDYLYLQAYKGLFGYELGYSGTGSGILYFANYNSDGGSLSSSSYPDSFTVFDGKLFLAATRSYSGREPIIYVPDGEPSNDDHHVLDTVPGLGSSLTGSPYFCVKDNLLFYSAMDADGDLELWMCDISDLDDIIPEKVNLNVQSSSSPAGIVVYDGKLYFSAETGDGIGRELYSLTLE